MKNFLVVYVHGKGGSAEEAEHYKKFFPCSDVVGFDYKSENVWEFKEEFLKFIDEQNKNLDEIILIANSIGAYFSMNALSGKKIHGAIFISPIVNMENIIKNMMNVENIDEQELRDKKIISTKFGENLSWEYFNYVRENKIFWNTPTEILYGEKDNLTDEKIIFDFAEKFNANVTVMKGGEHWFHTAEQMNFLDNWMKNILKNF